MTKPVAYAPEIRYKYQILCKYKDCSRWDHCAYAKDKTELKYLINEYSIAYSCGYIFKSILLPKKYWPKVND